MKTYVFLRFQIATATSAAAASATVQRAKDHEKRSSAMYSQTEELMKFQFMSMSLSYFSSLNMLKTMRDINADTTTAAVTSSADAAAAAAASAAAANLPGIKSSKVLESISDVVGTEVRRGGAVFLGVMVVLVVGIVVLILIAVVAVRSSSSSSSSTVAAAQAVSVSCGIGRFSCRTSD